MGLVCTVIGVIYLNIICPGECRKIMAVIEIKLEFWN